MAATLVDTDVFIDHIRGARKLPARDDLLYSVVTRCELFAGRGGDDVALQVLLSPYEEVEVDREVAEFAGRIRRESGLKVPDALIAGTALAHDLELMTRNARDFERVARLRLVSPDA